MGLDGKPIEMGRLVGGAVGEHATMAASRTSSATSSAQDEKPTTSLRFEYAWNWWAFHAKQRTTVFYYYLIITGIIANAYVVSYQQGFTAIAIALAVIGLVTSVASIFLDIRNHGMVTEGEKILDSLEDVIYPRDPGSNGSSLPIGPLAQETKNQMRVGMKRPFLKSIQKHTFCFRAIAGIVGLCFIGGAVLAIYKPWPGGPADAHRGSQYQSESWKILLTHTAAPGR
jgi:hypothetical protein